MLYPKPLQKLIDLFAKLPGIGPRQATRFAFFTVKEGAAYSEALAEALREANASLHICNTCFRTTENNRDSTPLCPFCSDNKRDNTTIAVVEKESDMQNLEKTGAFHGLYHILGGVLSPFDADSPKRLHLRELHTRIKTLLAKEGKCEVILATNSTTEGDMTALYLERVLAPLKEQYTGCKISRLGRGLSVGAELEYADEVTLKNALTNRK